jgi:hypothetical protein
MPRLTPDQVPAAQAWLKANPSDPKAEKIQAAIWVAQNPDSPKAAKIVAHYGLDGEAKPATQAVPQEQAQKVYGGKAGAINPNAADVATPVMAGAKALADDYEKRRKESYVRQGLTEPVMGTPPLAIPATVAGPGLNALANFLNRDAAARIGTNAAVGGAQAYAHGESPAWGAVKSAALASVPEGIQAAAEPARRLGAFLGRGMAGLSKEAADAFTKNAPEAKRLFDLVTNKASEYKDLMQQQAVNASGRLQQEFIDPLKAELSSMGAGGEGIRVNPSQFQGTEAYKEMERANALRGQTQTVPGEPLKVQEYQITPASTISTPAGTQKVDMSSPYDLGPRNVVDVPVSTVERVPPSMEPTGPATFLPTTKNVPAPVPEEMNLSLEQALRGARASGKAANVTSDPTNPLGSYAQSAAESQAAQNLRAGIKGKYPMAEATDARVHELLGMKEELGNLNNPGQLLQTSTSPSSTNVRGLRQDLDKTLGTNFEEQANQLAGATAMKGGWNPLAGDFTTGGWSKPIGKALIHGAAGAAGIGRAAGAAAPYINATSKLTEDELTLYNLLYGNGNDGTQK